MPQIRRLLISILAVALLGLWIAFFDVGIHIHLTLGLTAICMMVVSIKLWRTR